MIPGLDPAVAERLRATRVWARAGKQRLYRREAGLSRDDVFFAAKRVYRRAQRVPGVGTVITTGSAVLRRVISRGRAR
ncbi:hypothetical protein [Glaciihabitans sp. dw_435]|uniref:hypothetical protein n=1 Tax=Glaciihabitans sp. dw_435 TaxID=2720081 RepID=UPI001BD40791|nr:hypothetical protein [Glaciihabitans sp. dw_435]